MRKVIDWFGISKKTKKTKKTKKIKKVTFTEPETGSICNPYSKANFNSTRRLQKNPVQKVNLYLQNYDKKKTLGCPEDQYPKFKMTPEGNEYCCDITKSTDQDMFNYINYYLNLLIDRDEEDDEKGYSTPSEFFYIKKIPWLIKERNKYLRRNINNPLKDSLKIPKPFKTIEDWFEDKKIKENVQERTSNLRRAVWEATAAKETAKDAAEAVKDAAKKMPFFTRAFTSRSRPQVTIINKSLAQYKEDDYQHAASHAAPYAVSRAVPYAAPCAVPYAVPYAAPHAVPHAASHAAPYAAPHAAPHAAPYDAGRKKKKRSNPEKKIY